MCVTRVDFQILKDSSYSQCALSDYCLRTVLRCEFSDAAPDNMLAAILPKVMMDSSSLEPTKTFSSDTIEVTRGENDKSVFYKCTKILN